MNEERRARNLPIIEEFRANGGKVGGMHEDMTLLLLHHVGAKSGTEYLTPLTYLPHGERWAVFAANGGRPAHPGWYHNLLANSAAVIEVGTATHRVTARIAQGDEREALCTLQRKESPLLGNFERATDRVIPVVVFERSAD
jgi:deazaflavin-dependent oxidoreductase (nitroreductase family)